MRRFVIAVRCTGAGVAAGARMHRSATIQGRLLVGLVLPLVALTSCGPSPVDDSGSGSNEGPLKASLVLDSAQPHLQAGGLTEVSVSIRTSGTWSLTLSALPAGVTGSLSANTVTQTKPSTLTLKATSGATLGTSAFSVTGRSSGRTITGKGTLQVIAAGGPTRLRNVDVSVVYPLPSPRELNAMLRPEDLGKGGPLLDASVFEGGTVPVIDDAATLAPGERLKALRVVALRFDPCPGTLLPAKTPDDCRPDVRLVFQQLTASGTAVAAADGAIHAFYQLSNADFQRVLDGLRATRAASLDAPEVPLGVHPTLAREGVSGAFAMQMKSLISSVAGLGTLVRVTHFEHLVTGAGQRWRFAIREKKNGVWSSSSIATTSVMTQGLVTIVGGRWDADIEPVLTHPDDVTRVFKVSEAQEAEAFRATARVLNPRIHSSESLDCASCHIAPDVAVFGESVRGLSLDAYTEKFRSSYSLGSTTKSRDEAIAFDNIHLFSYLGRGLNVSARTANETAAILEMINGG